MRSLLDPAPRRGRGRRTRAALLTAGAAAVTAQLVPWVHVVLAMLVATSWTLIGLLAAHALAHRYGLRLPRWVSVPVAVRAVIRLVGRLRATWRPTPVSGPPAAERDCYELAGGPAMSPVGER